MKNQNNKHKHKQNYPNFTLVNYWQGNPNQRIQIRFNNNFVPFHQKAISILIPFVF